MSVININLFSMMLRRTIDVTVVLPDKINDDEKLPCVWLYGMALSHFFGGYC